jgi:hypothetical protein
MAIKEPDDNETHCFDSMEKGVPVELVIGKLENMVKALKNIVPPRTPIKNIETKITRVRIGAEYRDMIDYDFIFDIPYTETRKFQEAKK